MALEPYRQTIAAPREGAGTTGIVPANVTDISSGFRQLGAQLRAAFEPQLVEDAQRRAREDAGAFVMSRDENGNLQAPPLAEDGGRRYRQAFDQLLETRYLTALGSDYQRFLDEEVAARRTGERPFNPMDFSATVRAHTEGVLEGMDPRVRPQVEELFAREGMERERAFINEYGRTIRQQAINGANDQLRVLFGQAAKFREENYSAEEVESRFLAPAREIIDGMRQTVMMGDAEAEALWMQDHVLSDGLARYADSMEFIVEATPYLGAMDMEQVKLLRYWAQGANVDGDLSGLVTESTGVTEIVTPDLLRSATRELFGIDPTSTSRSPDDPLSLANPSSFHNTANGGRAVDMPAIQGLSIDDAVAGFEAAGFEVIEVIDEYANPSAHATGGHWHFGFGNTRGVMQTREVDMGRFNFETVSDLDPEARRLFLEMLTDREQSISSQATLAREEARIRRTEQAAAREQAMVQESIQDAISGRYEGAWNSDQRDYLDQDFTATVDMQNLADPAERNAALSFVQRYNHLPQPLVQYMTNTIRSEDWVGAVEMYRTLEQGTGSNGNRTGDLLLQKLDGRTTALLAEASRLTESQQPDQVTARLEQLRSGNGFTAEEARTAFNTMADRSDGSYNEQSDAMLRELFELPQGVPLDPQLRADFDSLFASNLDIANRDPQLAMRYAGEQIQRRSTRSNVFLSGVGPSVLLQTYSRDDILDFLASETHADTGESLLPPGNHVLGGNGNIRLVPLGSNTAQIGRYEVRVYDPANPVQLLQRFEVDLGRELEAWARNRPPPPSVDTIGQARRDHNNSVDWLRDFGEWSDRGPKF